MADNVTIPASGTGTETPSVATDDVGGTHFQRIKLDLGVEGESLALTRELLEIIVAQQSDQLDKILDVLNRVENQLSLVTGVHLRKGERI